MPSFYLKCLLLIPLCAYVESKNVSARGRMFVMFPDQFTDEPIPPEYFPGDDDVKLNRSTGVWRRNITQTRMSEEALQFLSGPVSTILIPSFYTLVCALSLPINIFAVLAFARGIQPKKPAAIYMLNLACADMLFAMMLPFKISYHFEGNDWRFGSIMCRVVTGAFYWNMYCTVLLIACISVDRLLAVVYPIDSLAWRRPRNSVIACVTMWILSFAASMPLVISEQTVFVRDLNITTCHDVQQAANIFWIKIYFITLCCALFFLPLLVTVVSYTRVIWSLNKIAKGLQGTSRKRTRAVVMALTVLVIFVLCFLPTNCLLLVHYLLFKDSMEKDHETPDGSYGLYLVFLCLGSLNCLLDPLVYYFGSSQCQRQLSKLLKCQKNAGRSSITHTSSDSCRSSSRAMLKSKRTASSKINSSVTKMDSSQDNLNSQYKKLLV
ncbi:proteinase-activated receptor 1-like [Cololabis saira]|uniref:proteinase-activated receptor 1-like n=1 Tax=Cololabis saira TaxID=129043 RepID=UPI002AD2E69E|nr:proteinase-activated receptor 1-like [Cololabis saira]